MMISNTGTEKSIKARACYLGSLEPAQKLDSKGKSQTERQNQMVRTGLRGQVREKSELPSKERV